MQSTTAAEVQPETQSYQGRQGSGADGADEGVVGAESEIRLQEGVGQFEARGLAGEPQAGAEAVAAGRIARSGKADQTT